MYHVNICIMPWEISLYYILLKDCPLSNREESCEFDKVKLEVEESEMTVEEHGVNLDSTEDHHRLVDIILVYLPNALDLVIRNIVIYWTSQSEYLSLLPCQVYSPFVWNQNLQNV